LGFDFSFSLGYLENSFFFDLSVVELPRDLIVVNIVDSYAHEFWIASLRLGNNFTLEIDYGWLENKFWFDSLG
jgi:hypothetical protein